jgi:hypothetical protein
MMLRPSSESMPIATRASAKTTPAVTSQLQPTPPQPVAKPSPPLPHPVVTRAPTPPVAATDAVLTFELPQVRKPERQKPIKAAPLVLLPPAAPSTPPRLAAPAQATPQRAAKTGVDHLANKTPTLAARNCGEALSLQSLGVGNAKTPLNPECR